MEYNKNIKYIWNNNEYNIKLYTNLNINNYLKIYVDNNELFIPLVENNSNKASHIKIYKNNKIYSLAFSL